MKKVDEVVWRQIRHQAHEYRAAHKVIPNAVARPWAEQLGISLRAFRRKTQPGRVRPPRRRRPFKIDAAARALIVLKGSLRLAAQATAGQPGARSYSTWRRAFGDLSPSERAALTDGETAMRELQGFTRYEAAEVDECWQLDGQEPALDTKELRAWLAVPESERVGQRPDLQVFTGVDDKSKVIRAWRIEIRAFTADDVLNTIADGVEGWLEPDGIDVGGAPRRLRWDNALQHIAKSIGIGVARLLIERAKPVDLYAGWMKAKVERLHGTYNVEFWSQLPGWRGGPDSPLTRKSGGRHPAEGEPLSVAEIRVRFARFVKWYNTERPHSSLGDVPPLVYLRAHPPAEVRRPSAEAIALARLGATERRIVHKGAIEWRKRFFLHWKLNDVGGEEVAVAPSRRDPNLLYVLYRGQYLCTAKEQSTLTDHERDAIYSHREAEVRRVRDAYEQAARLRTTNLEPLEASDTEALRSATPDPDEAILALLDHGEDAA